MNYILRPYIGLRSWWLVPHSYYIKGQRNAQKLSKEEFDILSMCDGKTEIDENELVNSLINRGFIEPCKKGEKTLDSWQKKECNNRYFPAMNWMITGKCNYNCLHCFNASDNSPLMSEFSLEDAERLLDDAEKCGINAFTITGGEPMCHKNFFEIIEGIYRRGMFIEELNTNGYYIDQSALDKMKQIGCYPLVKISFDGLGHHDWLRNRKGAEEDALRAIRLCIENGFKVKVQTNVHRKNVDSMISTVKLLDEMGVVEMRIIRTTEAPRWNNNADGATLELTEYYDRMLEFAESYISEEHRMDIDIWQFLTIFARNKSYRMRPMQGTTGEYRQTFPVCRGNRGMVAVAANGNVFPCMQMSGYYEMKNDILGNIKEGGLQPLLQGGKYLSEVCATVGELAKVNEECGNCKYFKNCMGGCRAIALALTGDKMGIDPAKCLFFQKGYYKKIQDVMKNWNNLIPLD